MYAYPSVGLSTDQRDALVLEHLPRVNYIAARIHEKLLPTVELDDLISAGVIGLLAAIDNYDPSHGASLTTYANHKIRGAILDSIRGLDGIPAHKRHRVKIVQQAITAAEQKLQRAPTEEEIAAEIGIPLNEYQEWTLELRSVSIASLEIQEDDEFNPISVIADPNNDTPMQILERAELTKVLSKGIEKMPENERLVLSLYYKEELTLREISTVMNLHTTRISQLRAQAVIRLRAYMEHKWPEQGKASNRCS